MSSALVVTGGRFHRYALHGQRLPTVTGIIGKAVAKPGLLPWAAKLSAGWAVAHAEEATLLGETRFIYEASKEPDRVRDASATAGKQVHAIAERLVYGDPVETYDPITLEPYPDDVIRMGEQIARFMM